jgi:hypothetical protein
MDRKDHEKPDAMSKWTQLPEKDRIEAITSAALTSGLPYEAVEKDWWVTAALAALFRCSCTGAMVFKGGTSLSKGWKLIERFSEDVDLAIDRSFFDFAGELRRQEITKLRKRSCAYVRTTLRDELKENLEAAGVERFTLTVPETVDTTVDPQIIELNYPSLFDRDGYILEKVLIEVGSRSLTEPSRMIGMRSIIAEVYPDADFAGSPVNIPTVLPTRTFLEKAFLLHEEFQKPQARVGRMSRHLYDLERLMDTQYGRDALADGELYRTVVEHRRMLTPVSGIDYSTHRPAHINFVPPDELLPLWEEDYRAMQGMIYGDSLPFDRLIARIGELNMRFRTIELPDE